MADRDLDEQIPKKTVAGRGVELLRVEGLSRKGVLHDISFSVHAGEIVGLSGLLGAGRTDLARALFGLEALDAGEIFVRGVARKIRSPRDAIRCGIGFLTEDRKKEGLILGRSVRDNIALPLLDTLSDLGVVRTTRETAVADSFVRDLRIRTPSLGQLALNLSGGNQQKIVLAKWLACRTQILFLDEPTRGIDVGAKQEIYLIINRLAAEGVGIVLISSELQEIVGLSDRVLVMRGGRIVGEFGHDEATQERLLACAVGA